MKKMTIVTMALLMMATSTACGAKEAQPEVVETGVITENIIVEKTSEDPYKEVKIRLETEYGLEGGEWCRPLQGTDERYGQYRVDRDGTRIWYTFDFEGMCRISTAYMELG